MNPIQLIEPNINSKIFTIRGEQVMLDVHLAELYQVDTRTFNQAVKRNEERFPDIFRFQLTENEWLSLRSQFVILNENSGRGQHRKYLPYVFTEQGIAMLSAVLRSEVAVQVSIKIMQAFVQMRHLLQTNSGLVQRLESVERKQLEMSGQLEQVFQSLEGNKPKMQGVFFEGETFNAYQFVTELVRGAKSSLILIDNYVDDTVLTLFTKRSHNVSVTIYTKQVSKQLALDLEKYNSQYAHINVKIFDKSHDRFLIIDEKGLYHIGASLKDLGKKWFAFSKMDLSMSRILEKLAENQ
ncbi:ORF6N domain-containing protein [Mannheimia haemolytica]|uniref:ORF6N domain-containing protein n=1 Tax=Mannheimia haemolytica TaxID=75985 RepID=UPI000385A5F3|nr:ORF6N domain-containing protein [Mannheimia haemolytica]EPY99343.1 fic family toxin-antitoxin system [Mannheimia haemolytica D35]MDW1149802.1 ORF6N domain-containing protein [Mannheimia haemolytica]MDW1160013.1 ORF6N domain-containing protein [Mannheimia haemolytica]NBB67426.1 ORF6N domain-containing protein [Mannheimia haemolytica]TRC48265.1 ORF6N domain-containing protein [Mannheimia haemolytica]